MEEELPEMEAWLQQIQIWNPEGIVYMDPAVFLAAEKLGFQDRLIYAPDTLMTNSRDLQMMLDLGVGRVVLAAEITLEEILEIARKTDGSRLELQIHGPAGDGLFAPAAGIELFTGHRQVRRRSASPPRPLFNRSDPNRENADSGRSGRGGSVHGKYALFPGSDFTAGGQRDPSLCL